MHAQPVQILLTLVMMLAPMAAPHVVVGQPLELPWTKNPGQLSVKRAATMRELLVYIDDSQWNSFQDGAPLSVNDDETLYRLLFRLPGVSGYDWQRLSRPLGDGQELRQSPAEHRGSGVRIQGRARRVERREVLPEVARRLEFDHYFRVEVTMETPAATVIICARKIPSAWLAIESLDEPMSCHAVFLKTTGAADDSAAPLAFATDRLAWHPTRAYAEHGVTDDHVLLASQGFDVGRLEDIAKLDTLPFTSLDTECFFQMLASTRELPEPTLKARAAPFDLGAVLQKPRDHHAQLFHVTGRARRVTKIVLQDPVVRDRFGIPHYYQVDIMVPVGDRPVRLARDKHDSSGPVLDISFPVVCCVLELPERLRDISDREDLNEDMTFDAFHMRLWSYQSQFLDKFDREQRETTDGGTQSSEDAPTDFGASPASKRRQPSPLFLARTAHFAPPIVPTDHGLGAIVTWVLLGAIAVGGLMLWRYQSGDRAVSERLRRAGHAEPPRFDASTLTSSETIPPDTDTAQDSSSSAPDASTRPKAN